MDTRWSLAGMIGFSSDNLNFGVGARGGKTLPNRIYIGGAFVYHLGDSAQVAAVDATGHVFAEGVGYSMFYTGPEGGYDIDLRYVVLRPYLGLGLAFIDASYNGPYSVGATSGAHFVFWPGAACMYDFPHTMWFVGGDAHLLVVPGYSDAFGSSFAFGFFAFGGVKLGS